MIYNRRRGTRQRPGREDREDRKGPAVGPREPWSLSARLGRATNRQLLHRITALTIERDAWKATAQALDPDHQPEAELWAKETAGWLSSRMPPNLRGRIEGLEEHAEEVVKPACKHLCTWEHYGGVEYCLSCNEPLLDGQVQCGPESDGS